MIVLLQKHAIIKEMGTSLYNIKTVAPPVSEQPLSSDRKSHYFFSAVAGFGAGIFAIPVVYNLGFTHGVLVFLPPFVALGALLVAIVGRILGKKRKWLIQAVRFLVVGFLNTSMSFGMLNFGSLITGIYAGRGIIVINVIAFIIAFSNSFIWNRYWTFGRSTSPIGAEFGKFLAVTLGSLALDTGLVFTLTTYIPHDGLSPAALENLAKVFGAGISMLWNFLGYKFVVFKK